NIVKCTRIVSAAAVVVLLAAGCGKRDKASEPNATTGSGGSTTAKVAPVATETGISATEIRIAVLADVQNPLLPGLFKGSKDAVIAFGDYVNKNGGIAGRKLVVDFIDTGLDPTKVKSGMQKACAN